MPSQVIQLTFQIHVFLTEIEKFITSLTKVGLKNLLIGQLSIIILDDDKSREVYFLSFRNFI